MRQFQGFTNKQVLSYLRNDAWRTVTMPFLDDDVVAVTVEFYLPEGPIPTLPTWMGARPVFTTRADDVFLYQVTVGTHHTAIVPVNASKQIQVRSIALAGQSETIAVTGQWGGAAVKSFGPNYPQATGWTEGNTGTYRDFDLSALIPAEDRGNVEAVICHLHYLSNVSGNTGADARGNGSTWNVGTGTIAQGHRQETVVLVDDGDVIEVREDGHGSKFDPVTQDSWVYFVGYILRGGFDDGSGEHYEYKAILNPSDDGVGIAAWQNYGVVAKTGADVDSVYWRLKAAGVGANPHYAREVGSTDAAILQGRTFGFIAGHPIRVDGSKEVQHNIQASDFSYIFGWLNAVAAPVPTPPCVLDGRQGLPAAPDGRPGVVLPARDVPATPEGRGAAAAPEGMDVPVPDARDVPAALAGGPRTTAPDGRNVPEAPDGRGASAPEGSGRTTAPAGRVRTTTPGKRTC